MLHFWVLWKPGDIMIYVLFINPFILRNRDITFYFNMTHYCVMQIASWVILTNLYLKQKTLLFIDTETIKDVANNCP
jgi:hypothetical protein